MNTQTNSSFHVLIFQAGAEQDFFTVGFNDDIRLECREDQFSCEDGITCVPWEQICDGFENCPQHENGNGGEDEVNLLMSMFNPKHVIVFSKDEGDSDEGSGGGCVRPPKPEPDVPKCTHPLKLIDKKGKNYVKLCFGNIELLVGLQTVVTFALLQLPAVSLAFYGVICAFRQTKNQPKKKIVHKITDSLLALTVIVVPYCFTEIFTLVQFEFTDKGADYLVNGVKSLCKPAFDKIVNLFPNMAAKTTFDLLKFLPNKDPNGRERSV